METKRLKQGVLICGITAALYSFILPEVPQRTPPNWSRCEHTSLRKKEKIVKVERTTTKTTPEYDIERIVLTAERGNQTVIDYYRTHAEGKHPLVFVGPILGGEYDRVETHFLDFFARNRMDAALVHRPNAYTAAQEKDLLGGFQRQIEKAVLDYEYAIDYAEQEGQREFCGFGISFGGALHTIVAALDHRLRYNVIALSGRFDRIIENQGPEELLQMIAKRYAEYGGKEKFLQEFNRRVTLQPQNYADGLDPERTLLFIARFDSIVPSDAAEALRKQAGYPTTYYLPYGHYTSVINRSQVESLVKSFFEEKIAKDAR